MQKKGFTLLELLIVIGILAILATAAVLVLNPAELLRQARDSTRASDLASINSTLGLYLSTVATPLMDNRTTTQCVGGTNPRTYSAMTGATSSASTFTYATGSFFGSTTRGVNGTGWLPINLAAMTGGSPLSNMPVDPSNTSSSGQMLTYVYGCDDTNKTYVITSRFESQKYVTDLGLPSKDGGPDANLYEVGTAPGLDL